MVFFPSTSLLRQLPENYSMLHARFRILQAGVPENLWWFCSSPSACVSPIPHEVHEGLSPVGTSTFALCVFFPLDTCWFIEEGAYDCCPWKSHNHCSEDFNGANMLEVASALLYIEDMRHALIESWWAAVGNKTVCVAPAIACHFRIFQGVFLNCPSGHVVSDTTKTEPSSSTSTLNIVA